MKTFVLEWQGATGAQRFDDVVSFVGEDASGSFGVLAGHGRLAASLQVGLARFRTADGRWRHVALPGGVAYFHDGRLTVSTREFFIDDDVRRVSEALREQLAAEEERLRDLKDSLHRMEQAVFRRLWEMEREAPR